MNIYTTIVLLLRSKDVCQFESQARNTKKKGV